MRTATSLTLLAVGAILAFAITSHPHFLNLQVTGLVIMATGVAGLLLPSRRFGWLRRRVVLRKGGSGSVVGHVEEERYPSYVMLNPAALDSVQPEPEVAVDEADPEAFPAAPADEEMPEWEIKPQNARAPGGSEIVADIYEE